MENAFKEGEAEAEDPSAALPTALLTAWLPRLPTSAPAPSPKGGSGVDREESLGDAEEEEEEEDEEENEFDEELGEDDDDDKEAADGCDISPSSDGEDEVERKKASDRSTERFGREYAADENLEGVSVTWRISPSTA